MKNNKNVRKDNLSPVDNSTKRVYKMYKSKKNWVVAPVVLLTLLGAVAPAPIALSNVVNATEDTATTLAAQREDAKAKIADLVQYGLTKDEVRTYQEAIDGLGTDFDAKIEEARVQASNNQLAAFDEAKTNAETKIASLQNLPTGYSAQYPTRPTYSEPDGKTDKALVKLVKAVADAKSAISALVNEATELNTAFANVDSAKAYVTSKVNGLAFVNEAYKAERVSELKTVDSKDAVYSVLTTATTMDSTNKSDLVANVTAKANVAFANDSDKVSAYTNKANAAKTPAEINALIAELDAKVFENNKESFKTKVNNFNKYGNEKQAFKDYFLNELKSVSNQEQLDGLNVKFDFVDSRSDLTGIKAKATSEIGTVNPNTGLVNLGFANPVKKADALRTVDKSNSALEVAKLYFSLKDEDAKVLTDARAKAKEDIAALSNLSSSEKSFYNDQITNATSADNVVYYANQAKQQNDSRTDSEKLAALKAQARESFKLIGEQDTAEIDAYHTGDNDAEALRSVKNVVSNRVEGKVNTVDSVEAARNLVNALLGIDSYKNDIFKALDADKNDVTKLKADVENAIQTARNEAEVAFQADRLAETIKNAIDEVNTMRYLSAEAKDDYTKALKTAKSEDEVTTILGRAHQANNDAMRIAQELAQAKNEAVRKIAELKHLSPSQAGTFVEQIRAASSVKDVEAISTKAFLADIDAITDVDEYKTAVENYLLTTANTGYEFKGLNAQQIEAYKKDLTNAKSLEDAKKVVAEAQAKNAKQNDEDVTAKLDELIKEGNYSQAKVKLASLMIPENISKYTKIVDDALALREKKLAALDTIAKADYLSATEKEKLAKEVSAAKDIAEVDKVLGKVTDKAPAKAVQLYRAYNPNSGEHLYTADKAEYDKLVGLGWHGEGNAWKAASKGAPVYRLYNPNSGEHFYTISESEYNDVAAAGWKKEGVAFYSDNNRGVEVYRLFNPNAKGAGSHHYTTLASERDTLIKAGWKYENVAFYGLK